MTKNNFILASIFLMLYPAFSNAQLSHDTKQNALNIIPKPVSIAYSKGESISIDNSTIIFYHPLFVDQAIYLKEQLLKQCGLNLTIDQGKPDKQNKSAIILDQNAGEVNKPEMYVLVAKNDRVQIKAKDVGGIVHGIQTLLQLLPIGNVDNIAIAPVEINDYPRFQYRGMHLDVSRHFFPVDFVKKYIDYLAFHKFNTFHWHLTDDQGWRIEIKSYPKLTAVGAWRDSSLLGHYRTRPHVYDPNPYGGYYTQEQVKDIIRYASIRGITIIPEIDIPGHSRSIIASYPELSTAPDTAWRVSTEWGTFNRKNNVLAPNEKTFQFLKTTFGEIADLFPSPYIHLGGDECSKIWWKADPETQAFIKKNNLKDELGLQTYFIAQVIKYLKLKGKKVIGWDEIIDGDLDTSAVIMNWQGPKAAINAVKRNHHVVMTPGKPLYFDFYQSKDRDSLSIGGYTPLDAVYKFEPVLREIDSLGLSNRVLGAQANVWTEYMDNIPKVEYMIFPRMTALSEVLWTDSSKKDFIDFKRRLKDNMIPRYQLWDANYFKNYEEWTMDK